MFVVIGASLLLSFGIGMLSGGLQHFDDFPARGAVLVPLGITVSFVAYVTKDADTPWQRIFSLVGLTVLLAAVVSFVGLRQVAASMGESAEGGATETPGGRTRTTRTKLPPRRTRRRPASPRRRTAAPLPSPVTTTATAID